MLYNKTVKIRDLFGELEKTGWRLDRIRGSHHVFIHPKAKQAITVPIHGKEISGFYARKILKQASLALGETA